MFLVATSEPEPEVEPTPPGGTQEGSSPGHAMDCNDIIIGRARGFYSKVTDHYTRDRSTPRYNNFTQYFYIADLKTTTLFSLQLPNICTVVCPICSRTNIALQCRIVAWNTIHSLCTVVLCFTHTQRQSRCKPMTTELGDQHHRPLGHRATFVCGLIPIGSLPALYTKFYILLLCMLYLLPVLCFVIIIFTPFYVFLTLHLLYAYHHCTTVYAFLKLHPFMLPYQCTSFSCLFITPVHPGMLHLCFSPRFDEAFGGKDTLTAATGYQSGGRTIIKFRRKLICE